jgi:hypothetical protein
MGEEEVPEGILAILITGPTQKIIQCVIDEDVTEENPYKLIQKSVFQDDIKKRAAVSDFSPFKKEINKYDGEEILLVLDAEFLYGQNFYIFLTEEGKNAFLTPAVADSGVPGEPG